MRHLKVNGAQQWRHELAARAEKPARQSLPKTNPTTIPARLREIADARRIDAAQRAAHLARRGGEEDYHARWARHEITKLLEEAEDLERQADMLGGTRDVAL